jgi:hypothetical protein
LSTRSIYSSTRRDPLKQVALLLSKWNHFPTPRVRVPRHVARLVTRLVAPLVVGYSASRRLLVDYFAYAVRPGASSRRVACHAARRASRRRPLHVARLIALLVVDYSTSRRLVVDYSALRRLVVDYYASAVRPVASARRAARRRLLRLRRASGFLNSSRPSSSTTPRRAGSLSTTPPRAGLSSTTSPTPRVRVPWYVARLVVPFVVDYSASRRLVVDYFASAARPGASARRAARHAARRAAR